MAEKYHRIAEHISVTVNQSTSTHHTSIKSDTSRINTNKNGKLCTEISYVPPEYYEEDEGSDDGFEMTFGTLSLTEENVHSLATPDRPVRVVPPASELYEYCGKRFEAKLDEPTAAWFSQFLQIWHSWKKSAPVVKSLHEYFKTAPNPYLCALKLYVNCNDHYDPKPKTLPYVIIEELGNWAKSSSESLRHHLTKDVQFTAFSLVKVQRNVCIIKLVCDVFKLIEQRNIFLDVLRDMIRNKDFKEACQWALLLKLHSYFTYEDFVLPLVLQDKNTLAEEFLDNDVKMQMDFVRFLDSLLVKNVTVQKSIEPFIIKLGIPNVKSEKLYHKPLGKLVARLCKKYNLPSECCPNLNLKRNEGALQFLLNKRYIEQSLGLDSWREMIQEAVKDNPDLHIELICSLVQYGDPQEAYKWALHYSVPTEHWPYSVKEIYALEKNDNNFVNQTTSKEPEECWDSPETDLSVYKDDVSTNAVTNYTSNVQQINASLNLEFAVQNQRYYKLDLPISRIILVDSMDMFENMIRKGLKDIYRVGLDAEWKPFFGTERSEIALIQIATGNFIYLLDVVSLGKFTHLWKRLSAELFENHNILKLGYGLGTDMERIHESLNLTNSYCNSAEGWLDLQPLSKVLNQNKAFKYPYSDEPGSGDGLSALVQMCLGASLDKANQFSNWELRPLRSGQIYYAALDAHCLLEVHDVIIRVCHNSRIPLQDICDRLVQDNRSPKKKNKKKIEKKQPLVTQPPSPFLSPKSRSVNDIKIICDNMVEGLARVLRRCGIDAISIQNNQPHDMCARIASKENRVILTRGTTFDQLRQHVPIGHCYRLKSDTVEEQLAETLQYYNIEVTERDILSRCPICNTKDYLLLSSTEMQNLTSGKFSEVQTSSNIYQTPRQNINIVSGTHINGHTHTGALIRADLIHYKIFEKVNVFYVCQSCGKCYWDGTHFDRAMNSKFKNIVTQ